MIGVTYGGLNKKMRAPFSKTKNVGHAFMYATGGRFTGIYVYFEI